MRNIPVVYESKRGCGYRKPGGMYFRFNGATSFCCKLPFELSVCPCCNQGIKPTRGFTWISTKIFGTRSCNYDRLCPANFPDDKIGLLWIGGSYYPTYEKFLEESRNMGVSRRIAQIPRGFKIGETWIGLAHRHAISDGVDEHNKPKFKSAIFTMFKPDRIEYVVKGTETDEELDALEKRGLTLIKVMRKIDSSELPE